MKVNFQYEVEQALVAADIMDAVRIGLYTVFNVLCVPEISVVTMENLITTRGCFQSIRKAINIQSDLRKHEDNIGRYSVNDFMNRVCNNLHNYLSGIFGVEIVFEENPDIEGNLTFDARLLEKAIYDMAYNMLCDKCKGKRITFYLKDNAKDMVFGARCNFKIDKPKKNFTEVELMYPDVMELANEESYASVMAKRMGGYAKSKYLKSMTRIELYIPKTLEISSSCMREEESVISGGERVMVHEVCLKGSLSDFFAAAEYKVNGYIGEKSHLINEKAGRI